MLYWYADILRNRLVLGTPEQDLLGRLVAHPDRIALLLALPWPALATREAESRRATLLGFLDSRCALRVRPVLPCHAYAYLHP